MTVRSDIGPFALVPEWVFDALEDDKTPIALYLALAFRANRATDSWKTSRSELAKKVGKSVDTIDRWTKALVNIGAITVAANFGSDGNRGWSTYIVHQAPQRCGGLPARVRGASRTDAAGYPHGCGSNNKNPSTRTPLQEPLSISPSSSDHNLQDRSLNLDDKPKRTRPSATAEEDGFDDFWNTCPRKIGKKDAHKIWTHLTRADRAQATAGMKRYAIAREGQNHRYTAHPATWLRGERWNDATETLVGEQDAKKGLTRRTLDEMLAANIEAAREYDRAQSEGINS